MFTFEAYPPSNDFQLSADHLCDNEACLSYSLVHCLEPQCRLYEDFTSYNPQYLAETSKTMAWGNTEPNVEYAFYQYGLVSTNQLPELTQFTWDQMYSRDLTTLLPLGEKFNQKYDVTIKQINASQALEISKQASTVDPYVIWAIVDLNKGLGKPLYHGQALLNGEIWDSYPTNPKISNNPIMWAYKVSLKLKTMTLVNDNGTFYIEGELGKIGIADMGTLSKLQKITAQIETRKSNTVPQVGVFKTQSVLVDQ